MITWHEGEGDWHEMDGWMFWGWLKLFVGMIERIKKLTTVARCYCSLFFFCLFFFPLLCTQYVAQDKLPVIWDAKLLVCVGCHIQCNVRQKRKKGSSGRFITRHFFFCESLNNMKRCCEVTKSSGTYWQAVTGSHSSLQTGITVFTVIWHHLLVGKRKTLMTNSRATYSIQYIHFYINAAGQSPSAGQSVRLRRIKLVPLSD